jgi:hypothetical protein
MVEENSTEGPWHIRHVRVLRSFTTESQHKGDVKGKENERFQGWLRTAM